MITSPIFFFLLLHFPDWNIFVPPSIFSFHFTTINFRRGVVVLSIHTVVVVAVFIELNRQMAEQTSGFLKLEWETCSRARSNM